MAKKHQKKDSEPNGPTLTKKEIVEFCDTVIDKWQKNPQKHAKHLYAINAVRMSVLWTEEDSLQAIWGEILTWAFAFQSKTAIAEARKEKATAS